jgi:uracil-DNA glycosylase family 4
MDEWHALNEQIVSCARCPRLRAYCSEVAETKRRAFRQWNYWGRPVPNFGPSPVDLLVVGLAPAAHGANRTGRMFTGDRSGDWLYRALHRASFANRPRSEHGDDGLELDGCAITAVCHCAPPNNKPARDELDACRVWLERAIDLSQPRAFLALGQIAWNELFAVFRIRGWWRAARQPFKHGSRAALAQQRWAFASYHPSQQNTFTGRLTEVMLDNVLSEIRAVLGDSAGADLGKPEA